MEQVLSTFDLKQFVNNMSDTSKQGTDRNSSYEDFFTNQDGKKIFCRYWSEETGMTKPRALVFIAHGVKEHCLCYNEFARELVEKELYVFAHDHLGHGQSEGDRVHVNSFSQYTRDVFDHVSRIQKKFPDVPVFIIGHSMGGAIAIRAALDRPSFFQGVILIAPAVIADPDFASPIRICFGKLVARILPQLGVLDLDSRYVCRDQEVVKRYDNDPLVYHGKLKARWGTEMLKTVLQLKEELGTIEWPFLVLHGTEDRLCMIDGSKQLYEQAKSKDKKIKIYDKGYHQVHCEPDGDGADARETIGSWILERV